MTTAAASGGRGGRRLAPVVFKSAVLGKYVLRGSARRLAGAAAAAVGPWGSGIGPFVIVGQQIEIAGIPKNLTPRAIHWFVKTT